MTFGSITRYFSAALIKLVKSTEKNIQGLAAIHSNKIWSVPKSILPSKEVFLLESLARSRSMCSDERVEISLKIGSKGCSFSRKVEALSELAPLSWRSEILGYTCIGYLGHPFLERKKVGVNGERRRGDFCREGCVASLFPVAALAEQRARLPPLPVPP